jgi:hypothetical protein
MGYMARRDGGIAGLQGDMVRCSVGSWVATWRHGAGAMVVLSHDATCGSAISEELAATCAGSHTAAPTIIAALNVAGI